MSARPELPPDIEDYRDQRWCREGTRQVQTAADAERFIEPRMIPYFHAVWGVRRSEETHRLSRHARAILTVLRNEWEMGSADLRDESGVKDRKKFNAALDELQAAMIVVPSEVLYRPKFT